MPIVGGCEKKRAVRHLAHGDAKPASITWNYFEDYWPCVGGLLAVNAIGIHFFVANNALRVQWTKFDFDILQTVYGFSHLDVRWKNNDCFEPLESLIY